jgi:flagellar FliL protein
MANSNEASAGEAKPKSGAMLWIIVGVVNVVLIGGGAFFVLTRSSAADPAQGAPGAHGAPPAAGAPAASGPLLKLDPFVANLNEPDGNRYIKVTVAVEVADDVALAAADKLVPRLRDAVLVFLSSLGVTDTQGAEGKEAIRKELLDRARKVLGERVAKNVFYSEFVLQ